MQTLNFNCSFCGKVMAVGLNLVGRNVRCPHCKQVVQAPATAGASAANPAPAPGVNKPAPPVPTFQPPPPATEGHESIFGEAHDDDLFGRPSPPQVKMPDDFASDLPGSKTLSEVAVTEQLRSDAPPRIPPKLMREAPPTDLPAPALDDEPWPAAGGDGAGENDEFAGTASREKLPAPARRPAPPSAARERGGIFVWMLILYALMATGVAAYLFYDKTQSDLQQAAPGSASPYLAIPDFFGQYDRAERKKAAKIEGMPAANLPLPDGLKVRMTETAAIGDLEVTPVRVEFRRANRFRKYAGKPDAFFKETPGKVYLLFLKLKNTSSDVYFHPSDPAFNRYARSQPEAPIYTGLSIGKDFIAGGSFTWPDPDMEYLEGQLSDEKPLAPREEREYVIASGPDAKPIRDALRSAPDEPVTWRVQFRRGLDKVKDASGKERDISVSSVIGVVIDRVAFPGPD